MTFAPTDISGLNLWLDASTLVLADGAEVATWDDQSTANNDATQSTSGYRPLYRATGAPYSRAAVEFDGSDDQMVTSVTANGAAQSVFAVVRVDNLASASRTVLAGSGSDSLVSRIGSDTYLFMGRQDVGALLTGGDAVSIDTWHVVAFVWDDANDVARVRLDDLAEDSAASVITLGGSGLTVVVGANSGTQFMDGKFAEILHYSAALSTTDVSTVMAYLKSKWLDAPSATPLTITAVTNLIG